MEFQISQSMINSALDAIHCHGYNPENLQQKLKHELFKQDKETGYSKLDVLLQEILLDILN